jgi:hypothetical protein
LKSSLIILGILLLNFFLTFSQPLIQWQKSFGGSGCEKAFTTQQTSDGGYIIGGSSNSLNDGDVTGSNGDWDYWIVKLNSFGVLEWEKTLGGSGYDYAYSLVQTTDKGFIVAGCTTSNDSEVSGNHGAFDVWVVKLDSIGNIDWKKCYGGSSSEKATSIQQTSDSGYIIAGWSSSNDGDVSGNHGNPDFWVLKLDPQGNITWQKSLGGSGGDMAMCIRQTIDGGFIVGGQTFSNNGDVGGNHGDFDFWIVKINGTGDSIQWQKTFGGFSEDILYSFQQTIDGGFILAGESYSDNGDVIGNHSTGGGSNDYWVLKIDSLGIIQWSNCFGGTASDAAYSVQQTLDGGYIVGGSANSQDGDVTGNHGLDYWLVKINQLGSIEWENCFGGTLAEVAHSIFQTTDGGYIIGGETYSNDSDVTFNHGCSDDWIVKLDSFNIVNVLDITQSKINFNVNPNPFSNETKISFQSQSSDYMNVEIRDLESRLIKVLPVNHSNEVLWDATNSSGQKVELGLYLVTLTSEDFTETKKAILTGN